MGAVEPSAVDEVISLRIITTPAMKSATTVKTIHSRSSIQIDFFKGVPRVNVEF